MRVEGGGCAEGGCIHTSRNLQILQRRGWALYTSRPLGGCQATYVQRATSCLPYRGIMSPSNPLSHGLLKCLGKLAELKGRGLILDRHFETKKTRVKAGNSVAKERWDAIESAWALKQNGIFDEGEWIAQVDLEIQGITSSTRLSLSSQQDASSARGAAAPSQHPPAAAAGTARRKVDRGKHARERAAKGTLGGNICNAFSIGSGQPIERVRGGVKEFVSGISSPLPAPESRRSCPHCPMTFVNEQGLGIHVRTQHSSANMSNGVRLRRMLRKNLGGRVLPWEEAGPGRCWHVKVDDATGAASFVLQRKRFVDLDLESDGFMDHETKETPNAVNQLRILENNAADLWKEEERTPLQYLVDRLKAIVAAAADDVKESLLAKQQPKRWFPEAEKRLYKMFVERRKRKLKVSTLWLTITFRKLVRETYPGDQRAAAFRASFRWARKWAKGHNLSKRRRTNLKKSVEERPPKIQRFHRLFRKLLQEPVPYRAPDESDVSAITTVAERESRVPKQCTMQVIFGPGEKTLRISVILRGTRNRISPVEKAANHKDVDKSYRAGLMRGRGELPKARSILIMDNLHAQMTDEFKEYLAKECNTLAWYGPSQCTDEVQSVDAGAGRFIKVEAGRQMDMRPTGVPIPPFEKCGMAMTVDGSGDYRITLEGLDKPYTFAFDEDCSEDEEGLENGSDEPEGRGKEGDGCETVVEGADSSDDEDDGDTSQTQTDELIALLDDDDSMDPQDPEDETQGMEIPTGFRIQEVKPVALDRLLLRRGVLVGLGIGWFGGLIIQQSQQDTRHLYDYCVQLELDQSTRKMRLLLDKYTGDLDATVGSWVLLESVSRSGRVRRTNVTLVDQDG
ncbi:unnamed protein product [Ectocarpus sp. CCAP 1310/34]|nr:unnamed protein product [Ectocarpus sp. CCAP 1310/34]